MGKFMESIKFGELNHFIVHSIGNKNNGDGVKFSEKESSYRDIEEYIIQLLLDGFKDDEIYQFYFDPKLDLNPVYQMVSSIFCDSNTFIEHSKNIGKYLYDKSVHPKIKTGELCFSYFKDCFFKDNKCDCIAIFKSEEKEVVLKVDSEIDSINLKCQKGIGLQKTKKGCIIFNLDKEDGFLVIVSNDINIKKNSVYWRDDFLHIRPVKNDFNKTKVVLDNLNKFISNQDNGLNLSKGEKISIANRSIGYFEDNEVFKREVFNSEVLQDPDIINFFDKSLSNDLGETLDDFSISDKALKKQKKKLKSVIKLDRNFHIYIHGGDNSMEKGIDDKGRKFYKFYYEDEL